MNDGWHSWLYESCTNITRIIIGSVLFSWPRTSMRFRKSRRRIYPARFVEFVCSSSNPSEAIPSRWVPRYPRNSLQWYAQLDWDWIKSGHRLAKNLIKSRYAHPNTRIPDVTACKHRIEETAYRRTNKYRILSHFRDLLAISYKLHEENIYWRGVTISFDRLLAL